MFLEELLRPLSIVFVLLLLALVWGKWRVHCLILSIFVVVAFSYPSLPWALSKNLVSRYKPVTSVDVDIKHVVVLSGGGFATDDSAAVNGRASPEYLYRFLEGVRLLRLLPESRMVLSVARPEKVPEADQLAQELADLVGLESHRIKTVVGARTTAEEAQLVREIVGKSPFYLVTSDYHLPRAMLLFSQSGLYPTPAAAGTCGRGDGERPLVKSVFPNAGNLAITDRNLHELMGILWEKILIEPEE